MMKKISVSLIIKVPDVHQKNRILKVAEKNVKITCKGKPIRITTDFSTKAEYQKCLE